MVFFTNLHMVVKVYIFELSNKLIAQYNSAKQESTSLFFL